MSKDEVPTELLRDIREHLEADRLIELGRAMRREVDRCPIRQMCKKIDEIVAARSVTAPAHDNEGE